MKQKWIGPFKITSLEAEKEAQQWKSDWSARGHVSLFLLLFILLKRGLMQCRLASNSQSSVLTSCLIAGIVDTPRFWCFLFFLFVYWLIGLGERLEKIFSGQLKLSCPGKFADQLSPFPPLLFFSFLLPHLSLPSLLYPLSPPPLMTSRKTREQISFSLVAC